MKSPPLFEDEVGSSLIEATQPEREKTRRKIFADVFDDRTDEALQKIISRKNLEVLLRIIAKGKEANVFLGKKGKTLVAVKIYRIETSNFAQHAKYLFEDDEVKRLGTTPQKMIYAWAKKEFTNMQLAGKSGVSVPKVIDVEGNVIIMQYLPEKTLKYSPPRNQKEAKEIYKQLVANLHKLIYKAKLIHADMSEYNLIFHKKKLYLIDFGQTGSIKLPNAKEFVNRDIKNIVKFFNKYGLKTSVEELKKDIRKGSVQCK